MCASFFSIRSAFRYTSFARHGPSWASIRSAAACTISVSVSCDMAPRQTVCYGRHGKMTLRIRLIYLASKRLTCLPVGEKTSTRMTSSRPHVRACLPALPATRHRLRLHLDYVTPPHEVQALRSDALAAVVKYDRFSLRVQLDSQRVLVHLSVWYGPSSVSACMHSAAACIISVSVSVDMAPRPKYGICSRAPLLASVQGNVLVLISSICGLPKISENTV